MAAVQQMGRRRTDAWLLRPDAPTWRYQGIAIGMGVVSVAAMASLVFLEQTFEVLAWIMATVGAVGTMCLLATHHIVTRFNASSDAYFLGFQAGVEACQTTDPAVMRDRVHGQVEGRVRLMRPPGSGSSVS